ncbi:MAG: hypothetical protein ACFE94_14360 [Candidatus Hodarchaeota archaeon]
MKGVIGIADSIPEEIERGWRLLNEGKEDEAYDLITEFESKGNLTPEEILRSLLEPIANFSVCYLYKGQTYLVKQKLANFKTLIQENASIEQILEKFEKTSQVLQIEDFPFLKPLITQIFIKK